MWNPRGRRCAARDLGGFWTVVDLAQGGVALVHVACWRSTIHVGGARDARLQDYQVSFVRCHRFVTVTAAQKISFISNPRAGRPVFEFTACSRARAGRGHMATRWGGRTVFRLLLQNGWVKHRDLLRVFGDGVMQQESSVGTV